MTDFVGPRLVQKVVGSMSKPVTSVHSHTLAMIAILRLQVFINVRDLKVDGSR